MISVFLPASIPPVPFEVGDIFATLTNGITLLWSAVYCEVSWLGLTTDELIPNTVGSATDVDAIALAVSGEF